jgi:hypothetical protein
MSIIKESKKRWLSETPVYFQKVRQLAISLGASATAIWVANDTMQLDLSQIILDICKYLITLSAGVGVTAQLTKVDSVETPNN